MEFPGYKIGPIHVDPGLVLSPMSGVTTSPFRRLIRELNGAAVGMLVSEFISVEALTRKVPRSMDMMRFREEERPYCIQIFGYDLNRMRDAALMVEEAGADIVDINCGCPAPKVVKKGGGCELMRQPLHLAKILNVVRASVSIPLTIKIRAGWDSESINALEIAKIAEAEGAAAVAVHGRTRTQMYRGEADWDLVHEIADQLRIPVLGSGDVADRSGALDKIRSGAVSGIFIGRGAMTNPFIFDEIVSGKRVELRKDPGRVLSALDRYTELLLEDFQPRGCVGKLKQLVSQMCKGYAWRKDLCRAKSLEEQLSILDCVKQSLAVDSDRAWGYPSAA